MSDEVIIDIEYPGSCLSKLKGFVNGEDEIELPTYRDIKELEEWLRLGGAHVEKDTAQDASGWLLLQLKVTW